MEIEIGNYKECEHENITDCNFYFNPETEEEILRFYNPKLLEEIRSVNPYEKFKPPKTYYNFNINANMNARQISNQINDVSIQIEKDYNRERYFHDLAIESSIQYPIVLLSSTYEESIFYRCISTITKEEYIVNKYFNRLIYFIMMCNVCYDEFTNTVTKTL